MQQKNFFDKKFMQLAIDQAYIGYEKNEIPIGCVIVDRSDGKIIAQTHNMIEENHNVTYHAEILAINHVSAKYSNKYLTNCDIYVTLEPCMMCVVAISNAKISRLYYAASNPKQGAIENSINFFNSPLCFHKPEIYPHIMQNESEKIINKFFHKLRH